MEKREPRVRTLRFPANGTPMPGVSLFIESSRSLASRCCTRFTRFTGPPPHPSISLYSRKLSSPVRFSTSPESEKKRERERERRRIPRKRSPRSKVNFYRFVRRKEQSAREPLLFQSTIIIRMVQMVIFSFFFPFFYKIYELLITVWIFSLEF